MKPLDKMTARGLWRRFSIANSDEHYALREFICAEVGSEKESEWRDVLAKRAECTNAIRAEIRRRLVAYDAGRGEKK